MLYEVITDARTVADFLVADFEQEMQTTLRVFEAVPNQRLDYRPDSKGKTGLELLRHIGLEDAWMLNCIANGTFTPPPDDSDACGIMSPADAAFFRLYDTRYIRRETKDYVPKLIAAALIAKQPEKYGFPRVEGVAPLAYDSRNNFV